MSVCWWICSIVSCDRHIFLSLLLLPSQPRWFVSRPAEVLISEFRFVPSQHSCTLLKSSPRRSDSTVLPLLCPLICVRSCFVYLSIYLSVCLPVSMSLCVCLAFCLSVCTSGCLPLSVSPPSVAWACGTPRDECSFPTRFQMWCSARMTAASQPTSPCSSPAATGWLPCSAVPSWRVTSRR